MKNFLEKYNAFKIETSKDFGNGQRTDFETFDR